MRAKTINEGEISDKLVPKSKTEILDDLQYGTKEEKVNYIISQYNDEQFFDALNKSTSKTELIKLLIKTVSNYRYDPVLNEIIDKLLEIINRNNHDIWTITKHHIIDQMDQYQIDGIIDVL